VRKYVDGTTGVTSRLIYD